MYSLQTVRNVSKFSSFYEKARLLQNPIAQTRCFSTKNHKFVGDPKDYTEYEIKYNPEEWKYVEQLLPSKWIPDPSLKKSYPSGWKPQTDIQGCYTKQLDQADARLSVISFSAPDFYQIYADSDKVPYFVERTKNHMLPVYMEVPLVNRGMCRITLIRKVEGDIWKLSEDLVKYLKPLMNYATIGVKVEELNRTISFRGDYVYYVKKFLEDKGF